MPRTTRLTIAGFTLIELTIVLFIVGLVLTGLVSMYVAQVANSQLSSTRSREDAIKTSLITFISRNNRLPCPAVATLPPTDPQYGREAATPGTCTGTIAGGSTVAVGVLPWLDLGLTDEAANDAYNHRFTYAVVPLETNRDATTIAGMTGLMNIYNNTPVAPEVGCQSWTPSLHVMQRGFSHKMS